MQVKVWFRNVDGNLFAICGTMISVYPEMIHMISAKSGARVALDLTGKDFVKIEIGS